MKRSLMFAVALILITLTTGCATFVAPSYSPDYPALDSLKRQNMSKIAVEPFQPKDLNEKVNKITLRGNTLTSPSGNYAQYLEDAIKSDLSDANLLDPNSTLRLFVLLINNDIDIAGANTGNGTIEATFKINQNGTSVFDKRLAAKTEFESSFAGAVAIPRGQNEYPNLVRTLLRKLYTDKDFIDALQK